MRPRYGIALGLALIGSVAMLSACGKKAADDTTNIIEMNASDGTMNDMTVVESTTLDQAGGNGAADDGTMADNAANSM